MNELDFIDFMRDGSFVKESITDKLKARVAGTAAVLGTAALARHLYKKHKAKKELENNSKEVEKTSANEILKTLVNNRKALGAAIGAGVLTAAAYSKFKPGPSGKSSEQLATEAEQPAYDALKSKLDTKENFPGRVKSMLFDAGKAGTDAAAKHPLKAAVAVGAMLGAPIGAKLGDVLLGMPKIASVGYFNKVAWKNAVLGAVKQLGAAPGVATAAGGAALGAMTAPKGDRLRSAAMGASAGYGLGRFARIAGRSPTLRNWAASAPSQAMATVAK